MGLVPYLPTKVLRARTKVHPPGTPEPQELTLIKLVSTLVKGTIVGLPKLVGSLGVRIGVAFALNSVLGSIATWKLGGFLAGIVTLLVFLTASYNSIIPKALFWILVFTIGTKLYHRVRAQGYKQVIAELSSFVPSAQAAWHKLGRLAIPMLGIGGGIGFMVANYLSRNNRIDKMLVCYITAISIIDSLSRGTDSMLFLFAQAAINDYSRLTKRSPFNTVSHSYIIGGGLSVGLCLNTLISFLKFDYGGYALGLIIFAAAIVYAFSQNTSKEHALRG